MNSRLSCNSITCLNGKPTIFVHLQSVKFINKTKIVIDALKIDLFKIQIFFKASTDRSGSCS